MKPWQSANFARTASTKEGEPLCTKPFQEQIGFSAYPCWAIDLVSCYQLSNRASFRAADPLPMSRLSGRRGLNRASGRLDKARASDYDGAVKVGRRNQRTENKS